MGIGMDAARPTAAPSNPLKAISDRLTAIAAGATASASASAPRAVDRELDALLTRHGRQVAPIAPDATLARVRAAPAPAQVRIGAIAWSAAAVGAASVLTTQALIGGLGPACVVALAPAAALLLPRREPVAWQGVVLCAVVGALLTMIVGIAAATGAGHVALLLTLVGLAYTALAGPIARAEMAFGRVLGLGSSSATTHRLIALTVLTHGWILAGA